MEIDIPRILLVCLVLYGAYRILSNKTAVECTQWSWRILMVLFLVVTLLIGGLTGEEIIPILGLVLGEGAFGAIKALAHPPPVPPPEGEE
ncbi:MAG: hypothetical protein COZ34_03920 [Candidatus Pacebacteria bacterium CG_4_10_14_3_um_filter_34_15]|nr:MAG: hypothetical protein COZ34_03920 [Candidatus Pacebacteria bacterium CG_4_10_14_3_um_filter_34_15]